MLKMISLLSAAVFCFFIFPAQATGIDLQIYHLDGEAQARSAERQEWEEIKTGEKISPASEIRVDSGSYLELEAENAHRFRFNESTGLKFNLDNAADTLQLYYGSIEIELIPERMTDFDDDFTVHTPVSTMGVRGTEFKTAYEMENTNWTGVSRGAVWFEADTGVELTEGQGADVETDTPADRARLRRVGEIREELRITWEHWRERKQIKQYRQMLAELEEEISSLEEQLDAAPRRRQRLLERNIRRLKNRKEQIENRLAGVREDFAQMQERYNNYRRELEEKREDFIENRQEAFIEFIEERKERFEEFRERREERRNR